MYSRPGLSGEYIRPTGSGGSSMLCCSLPCGRREWRELRHKWTSLIGLLSHLLCAGLWSWGTYHPAQRAVLHRFRGLQNGTTKLALATCSPSQPLLNMNIEQLSGHPVMSSMTSPRKNAFSGIIWYDLLIFDVKLKFCLIFWHFQNGCHFEVRKSVWYFRQ